MQPISPGKGKQQARLLRGEGAGPCQGRDLFLKLLGSEGGERPLGNVLHEVTGSVQWATYASLKAFNIIMRLRLFEQLAARGGDLDWLSKEAICCTI